jgi:hypothetical protein
MADSAEILEASLLPADDGSDEAPEPGPRRRPPLVAVLAGALVLALAAAGVLGWTVWRDRSRSLGQADAVALVEQYTSALDSHDLPGLHETLADQASFAGGEHVTQPVIGPFSGKELDAFYGSLFRVGVRVTTDSPMQVTGKGPYQVVAVQTVRYTTAGIDVSEHGVSLFTLQQLQDRPVILEHVWWRPLSAHAPSLLRAR